MAYTEEHDQPQPITSRRPRPLGSLIAAAERITNLTVDARRAQGSAQDWQTDAWDMYDLVGEEHFLATTLANRLGQAHLYVGKISADPTEPPEPVDDGKASDAFTSFAGSQSAVAQLVSRLGVNLFVAGDGWLVGIPRTLLPASHTPAGQPADDGDGIPAISYDPNGEPLLDLDDLEWRMLSVTEVTFDQKRVTLKLGEGKDEQVTADPDDVFLVRVWRPHPQKWWQADSPTRASLPVLRELVGLTEHVSAQVDSRLAGAGMLVMPQSAADAILQRSGVPEDAEDDYDPFVESLIEAMTTPIKDRSSASAYVPLVVEVPDDAAEKIRYLSFATPLDAEARNLREEAIRRLALGQDCPPEVLLGMGDSSHWSAWLVREDTITTHIEPPLALICDALTTQFLRPVLRQQGMDPDEADEYVVWYDVSDMIMRPNRIQDAQNLHAAGVISDEAYREAAGFSELDAPTVVEDDPAVTLAFELVKGAPSLAQTPGIPALVEQIRAVTAGTPTEAPPAGEEDPAGNTEGEMVPPSGTINDVDIPADTNTPPPAADRPPAAAAASGTTTELIINGSPPSRSDAADAMEDAIRRLNQRRMIRT